MELSREHPSPAVFQLPRQAPAAERSFDADREKVHLDVPLLRQNVVWFCQLRWIVVLVLLIGAVAGSFPGLLEPLGLSIDSVWWLGAAGVLAAANLVYRWLTPAPGSPPQVTVLRLHLWTQIVLDLLVLTVVVYRIGSVTTFAPFMYLFHIILACIFFSRAESLVVAIVAAVLYAGCVALEWTGAIEPATVFVQPGPLDLTRVPAAYWSWQMVFVLAIWAIIWYLASGLAGALREREQRLAIAHNRLKVGSEERARHMLQTTHQLKAPFAAIHANSQLLLGGYCGELPEKAQEVAEKIAARCGVISQQITETLQLANLRSEGQTAPAVTRVDLAQIIQLAVERIGPTAARRNVRIEVDAEHVAVRGIEDHLRMLVDNLVGNAVYYSYCDGIVSVTCRDGANVVDVDAGSLSGESTGNAIGSDTAVIEVRDRGIGILPAKLPRIFEDYYRTREAAHHSQSSTGLGLAIVRDVARAADIDVTVQSAPGWGTCFTVTVPKNEPQPDTRPSLAAERERHAVSPGG
jgi:signal transduction histidine kinase